jgi:hypothetical protein
MCNNPLHRNEEQHKDQLQRQAQAGKADFEDGQGEDASPEEAGREGRV